MMIRLLLVASLVLPGFHPVCGFMPSLHSPRTAAIRNDKTPLCQKDLGETLSQPSLLEKSISPKIKSDDVLNSMLDMAPLLVAISVPLPAEAATAGGTLVGGLVSYLHYASLFLCTGIKTLERCTVRPNMNENEEQTLFYAEVAYLLSVILVIFSGSLRVTDFGKGADFYGHEALFWLKMVFVGVWTASSLFPSITILKRKFLLKGDVPMSPRLADRLKQVMNAELTALLTIPLTATLMARGVLYFDGLPWQAGLAVSLLVFTGLGFKYSKEALLWQDDEEEEALAVPATMEE